MVRNKNVIDGVFNETVEDEVINNNPSYRIKLGTKQETRSRKPQIEPLNVDEVNTLLDAFREKKPQFEALIQVLVAPGMRIGEASALRWDDADVEDRSILIRRNYVRGRVKDSTKNGKDRKVDIPVALTTTLKSLRAKRAEAALKAGTGSIDKDWIFSSIKDRDKPLNYRTFRRDVFYPMLEAAGIRRIRIHDLRHTFASIMIDAGCNLVYLRDQLGHHSITVTGDVYGHLLKGNDEKPVDVLDKTLHFSAPYMHPTPAKTKKAPAKRVASA